MKFRASMGFMIFYDIVLKVSSDDGPKLRSIVTNQVRKIENVQSTLTMMVIEEQE